jgi:hypothetical protein
VARGDAEALTFQEAGSGTVGHMAMLEPSRTGRWVWSRRTHGDTRDLPHREAGLVLWDTWRRQSPPMLGGGVWHREAHGDAGALPCRHVGSDAVGHVVTPEPFRVGRSGLTPWDM